MRVTIDPGKMDRLITVQQKTDASPAQTTTGEPSFTWTTYKKFWAQKLDVGGRERFLDSGRQAEVNTVFRTHYDSGVTEAMRISYNSVNYDIMFVNELGRSKYLEIRCRGIKD